MRERSDERAGFLLLFTLLISIVPKYITLQPSLGKMLLPSVSYSFLPYKPVHPNIPNIAIIPSVNTCWILLFPQLLLNNILEVMEKAGTYTWKFSLSSVFLGIYSNKSLGKEWKVLVNGILLIESIFNSFCCSSLP